MDDPSTTEVLSYIDSYWEKVIAMPQKHKIGRNIIDSVMMRFIPEDMKKYHVLQTPYACIFPNDKKFQYIFYWDTFFMFQGVVDTRHEWIIPSMVENFIFLFKKYGIIPNFTHPESLGRSQPPFLTSMIFLAYEAIQRPTKLSQKIRKLLTNRNDWLLEHISVAKQEYKHVWMNAPEYNHFIEKFGLNRYGNRDVGYAQPSEQESGWDMTSRFYSRCNHFLPVDLNCYLYIYECDFAKAAGILGHTKEQKTWLRVAECRRKRMQVFWNKSKGFFYDYDYVHKELSEFESLAGFVPMYAKVATPQQAKKMVKKLPSFETEYGLTITTKESLPLTLSLERLPKPLRITMEDIFQPKQWDYPNIWPPLEYLTVMGLLNYGYSQDAIRIMQKSLHAHVRTFKKYHTLLEKLDGLTGLMPTHYWYPTQTGFGWTNAIFYKYVQLLGDLEKN